MEFFLGNFSGNASFLFIFIIFFKILVICNFSTVRSIFSNMQSVTVSSLALGKCFTEAQQILWCDLHLNRWMKSLKAKSYLSLQKMLKKNHIEKQREKHQNTLDVPEWSWNIQLCMNGLSHFVPLWVLLVTVHEESQTMCVIFIHPKYPQTIKREVFKMYISQNKNLTWLSILILVFPQFLQLLEFHIFFF